MHQTQTVSPHSAPYIAPRRPFVPQADNDQPSSLRARTSPVGRHGLSDALSRPTPDTPVHQRSVQPGKVPGDIRSQVEEVISEEWAVGQLQNVTACLNDANQAIRQCIEITVVLPGSSREVSVAPPESGMTPEQLKPYLDAARKAFGDMGRGREQGKDSQVFQNRLNLLKTTYCDSTKSSVNAPDWDTFLANIQKDRKRTFRCELNGVKITMKRTSDAESFGRG